MYVPDRRLLAGPLNSASLKWNDKLFSATVNGGSTFSLCCIFFPTYLLAGTFSVVVNLTQNTYLLQSTGFHLPRIVWQPPLPFYCSNWAEIELCLALAVRWLGLQLVLNISLCSTILRWPFPAPLKGSSNWFFLLLSAEANKNLHRCTDMTQFQKKKKKTWLKVKYYIVNCSLLIDVMSRR